MIAAEFAYPYRELSGFIKVSFSFAIELEPDYELYIIINDVPERISIDRDYLREKRAFSVAINTYAVPSDYLKLQLRSCSLSKDVFSNPLICNIHNPKVLVSSCGIHLQSLPKVLGLPLDSRLLADFDLQILDLVSDTRGGSLFADSELNQYDEKGWVVKAGQLPDVLVDELATQIDLVSAEAYQGYQEGTSQRLEHLHLRPGPIRTLFHSRELKQLVSNLYGMEMIPCQTLTYKYGSQQEIHSDFIHLSSYPENLMCGVWVAIEDVQEGSGELQIFEGTHKSTRLCLRHLDVPKVSGNDYSELGEKFTAAWKDVATNLGIVPQPMRLKKGDVLVWDGNLLHGGSPRSNMSLTRKSVVLHFFAKGAVSYYDATGDVGLSALTV